jgi:hypothetical protein
MFVQTINVPINQFAVGTLMGGGVPTCLLIAVCALLCAAAATDALGGGGCPFAHALLRYSFKYITASLWSALTENKLVSALVPRPPPFNLNVMNIPFPLRGGEVERENALQTLEVYR